MRWIRNGLMVLLVAAAAPAGRADEQPAQEPAAPPELNELEREFIERMANTVMVGRFTIDGRDEEDPPKPDRYEIVGVRKLRHDAWVFTARMKFEGVNVQVPVPIVVTMRWAGDTPVVSVTDLEIPVVGRGKFGARVLFHGNRYAGTWQHDDVGGHMWGRIEKQKPPEAEGK